MMTQYKTRPLSKSKSLHTNDTIHKSIRLDPLSCEIVNTPHIQRLRKLKQLGSSEFTYVNANHTRFEHSLGVGHLGKGLLERIREEQPSLKISDVDIKCVEIAGYCHDLGHGCYSHVYDGEFKHQLSKATIQKSWMGRPFNTSIYNNMPSRPEGWAHEDDSLMMLDSLLAYLGLAVNMDDLDGPLQQIGNGVDARMFGIHDSTTGNFEVITSRDVVFIKECIAGGPLPGVGMSIEGLKKSNLCVGYIGRMDVNKEFLYDVISNRHSGFDFDKGDYLARDKFYCFGFKGFEQCVLERLFDNACVAWSECVNPRKCFRCKHNNKDARGEPVAGRHLTICWPQKTMPTVREFFRERFQHHLTIYRHPTTQACSFMICDILLLADPHMMLSTENELSDQPDNNDDIMHLPISRANVNPNSYWKLDDSILDLIHKSSDPNLRPARQLINRMKSRKLYKLCGEHDIQDEEWEKQLWNMKEDEIVSDLLKLNDGAVDIEDHYIIIEKRGIHHGMGATDPVSCVRFVQGNDISQLNRAPDELPTAVQLKVHACLTPKSFLMQTVRVYCRVDDDLVVKAIQTCFNKLIEILQMQVKPSTPRYSPVASSFAIDEGNDLEIEEEGMAHNEFNVLTQSPTLNDDQSHITGPSKRAVSQSLYDKVVKQRRIADDM